MSNSRRLQRSVEHRGRSSHFLTLNAIIKLNMQFMTCAVISFRELSSVLLSKHC